MGADRTSPIAPCRTPASRVAALAALILIAESASSAACATRPAALDLRVGLAASRFGGSIHGAVPDGRISTTAGLALNFTLGPSLSICPEIGWISKGGEFDQKFAVQSGTTIAYYQIHRAWVTDYVEIPLIVRWESLPGSRVRPFMVLGPGLAWRTGSKAEYGRLTMGPPRSERVRFAQIFEDLSGVPRFRQFDMDAIGGIGIAAGRGRVGATIEARYLHGLRNVMSKGASATAYMRAFTITAGLELR
jgi:hypothetical protein